MSDKPNKIRDAQELLDSLYNNGDLSVDQHAGIAAGLKRVAELERERDQWRSIRADETKELRRIAESAGVMFESSRDADDFEHWAWRLGDEYHPGSVAEGGAAFGALRWICAEFGRQRSGR